MMKTENFVGFPSPLGDSILITRTPRNYYLTSQRFRPLSGIQFSLPWSSTKSTSPPRVSVPSRGFNSHYPGQVIDQIVKRQVSVPSRGFNSHYQRMAEGLCPDCYVSVPSRGFNSHYRSPGPLSGSGRVVSVPSRGFNSHYPVAAHLPRRPEAGFRPLSGIQFSLPSEAGGRL